MSELARERAIELEDECFKLRARVAELEATNLGLRVGIDELARKQCDCGAKE